MIYIILRYISCLLKLKSLLVFSRITLQDELSLYSLETTLRKDIVFCGNFFLHLYKMCNKTKFVFILFSLPFLPFVVLYGIVFAHGKWCISRIYWNIESPLHVSAISINQYPKHSLFSISTPVETESFPDMLNTK